MGASHEIQRDIILKLIHKPRMSFTDLLGDRESSKFSYHITTLEDKGIILKNESTYSLSGEGKKLSAFIEGDTGDAAVFPTFAHGLIIKNNGKILIQERLKEPFFGYWGLISGKINFGFNVEECAKRDLHEETGLTAEVGKLKGINQIKTYKDGELVFHHIIFLVELSNISGELRKQTHKGLNEWMTLDEFKTKKRLPDPWLDDVVNTDRFIMLETERTLENDEFTSCVIKSQRIF